LHAEPLLVEVGGLHRKRDFPHQRVVAAFAHLAAQSATTQSLSCSCWWWKGGAECNALGRSRGGFSTKINARTNAEGLPIGFVITPGEAHDITAFLALMQEVNCDPEQLLGDKGYYSDAVEIIDHGGEALIPTKANRKVQYTVDKAIYRLRNRIERFFNRLKNSRRVATRYDKLIESFAAFVILATIRIWIGFVRTT
jgi:transposase